MVQRLTYRRRHPYNTKSNKIKQIKTPGGVLAVQYRSKSAQLPKCGECKNPLQGIKAMRPKDVAKSQKRERTVSRAYGGHLCARCVRQRIVRAFLIEEQKIVKSVMRSRKIKA